MSRREVAEGIRSTLLDGLASKLAANPALHCWRDNGCARLCGWPSQGPFPLLSRPGSLGKYGSWLMGFAALESVDCNEADCSCA